MIATDVHGRIVLVNAAAEKITGWSQAESVGRPFGDIFRIVCETSGNPVENPVQRVLATGAGTVSSDRTLLVRRDGTRCPVADGGAPIRDEAGTIGGVVLVFRDTTDKRRLEEELIRAAKLESISLLAAGIAHDFNNTLTAITANVSLARAELRAGDPTHAILLEVEDAARQARDMTQELLTFAKGGVPVREPQLLAGLVRDAAAFALRGANVRCDVDLPADLWPVDVDAAQLSQVIHNLVINAQQAMPKGGVVTIRGANVVVDEALALSLRPGRHVTVSVEDHGSGIDRAHLAKIFDPFFTTKPTGTGLGLSTSYSILKRHDGHIACESEPGRGSTFRLWLPASDRAVAPAPLPSAGPRHGRGRVLVMDDHGRIRDAVSRSLRVLGYEPSSARDGTEAIALYEEHLRSGRRFDAVIMDLTIPGGMGGREALERLRVIDPGVRAIVSSGYSHDPVMASFRAHGFLGLIAKPYGLEELATVLEEVLGEVL